MTANHGTLNPPAPLDSSDHDPSRRFVLPPSAPLVMNLAALWAADARLAARVEAQELPEGLQALAVRTPMRHNIEPSRSGLPTLSVRSPGGRVLYMHSKYEPLEEANRLVDSLNTDSSSFYYVFGLGLGYHLESLFDRLGAEAFICVFEPDLSLIRVAFEHRDLSRIIESGRVLLFTQLDKPDLFARLNPFTSLINIGAASLDHAASMQLQPQFHQQMRHWVDEFASFARTAMNTLVLNGRRTAENITRNLKWYVCAPGLERLRDRYKGKPAIIVSAGPSLRKNKHLLKGAVGKAVLIAVQTTLQPLLEIGVEPQFVTSLDYHEICSRFFEKLPPSIKTELIAEPKATDVIFNLNPGPLTLLGNDFAENMIAELNLQKPRLPAGATVAHLAYYLAEFLGCDPIIFVGQDLGFSDGLAYMPGTSYEDVWRPEFSRFCTVEMKQWEQIVRDRPILKQIADYQGRPMYTEERLFVYLQQFERDFAKSKVRLIDATEGGAMKRGTMPMTLENALASFCASPLTAVPEDHPGSRHDLLLPCRDSLRRRCQEAGTIEEISRTTLPLLEEVRDHLSDQTRVNRAIARIDALRNRMNGVGRTYDLVMQLTQCSEVRRFASDREIAASKSSGIDRQRRQVNRDVANVHSVIDASKKFRSLIEEVLLDLDQEIARRVPHSLQEAA